MPVLSRKKFIAMLCPLFVLIPWGQAAMSDKKLVILGMDGLDPKLVHRFMDEGELPHFKELEENGIFSPLQTSNPPQSPVAWSCFISGGNPGQHDLFDFVIRDPSTYLPQVGMTEEKKADSSFVSKLMAGLQSPNLKTRRKGKSFWDILGEHGIKNVILRCPVTFPAEPLEGRLISGMGTPDIRGTQGVSAFYTTRTITDKDLHGRILTVTLEGGKILTDVSGPRVKGPIGSKEVTIPLAIEVLNESTIQMNLSGQTFPLKVQEWSPWVRLEFKTGPLQSLNGIVKFHLNSIEPEFELFMTPVNLDPQKPALSISYPAEYAKELSQKMGNYYTQGMPYDTWALTEKRLSEEKFLEQAYSIMEEQEKTLAMEMSQFESGLLFAYFGVSDSIQHMFWRYLDEKPVSAALSSNPNVKNAIRNIYKEMDRILGEVQKKMEPDTALIVLSDHGFGPFRRSVHINSWLRDNGFLVLKNEDKEGSEFFMNVDWSQTRAYAVGFGGIYINQFGREKSGIVYKGAEKENLKKELVQRLNAWKDKNGSAVIKKVYRNEEIYQGPYSSNGPDLFIGFHLPYRASWQTGLGGAPLPLIEDNTRAWSGDHLCDPTEVPGVFFSTKHIQPPKNVGLMNISGMILDYFGVKN